MRGATCRSLMLGPSARFPLPLQQRCVAGYPGSGFFAVPPAVGLSVEGLVGLENWLAPVADCGTLSATYCGGDLMATHGDDLVATRGGELVLARGGVLVIVRGEIVIPTLGCPREGADVGALMMIRGGALETALVWVPNALNGRRQSGVESGGVFLGSPGGGLQRKDKNGLVDSRCNMGVRRGTRPGAVLLLGGCR